ncbi:hypothetical protein ACWGE0_17080 [Lentzea sp. NPDC054927]
MRWLLLFFGLVALAGAVLVVKAGLENADQIASVVGAAAGLLSLAFTIYAFIVTKPAPPTEPQGNTISNSTVHGSVTQVRDVKGDLNL